MTEFELSRRGALAALAAAGAGVAGGVALTWDDTGPDEGDGSGGGTEPLSVHHRETLVALAETLYPTDVSGIPEFVEAYVAGRVQYDRDRAAAIAAAIDDLDGHTGTWYDEPFADLEAADRDAALREFGLDDADPIPDGDRVERVRYYLVNDLLFALYASPTGGNLLGIENPPGHPGGLESYRRGPAADGQEGTEKGAGDG